MHAVLVQHTSPLDYRMQISKMAPLMRKQVDDVLGGDDAWKNVAKTDGESQGLASRSLCQVVALRVDGKICKSACMRCIAPGGDITIYRCLM